MLKKILLGLLILQSINISVNAQIDDYSVKLSLATERTIFAEGGHFNTYGLNLEFYPNPWLSLGYHFSLGNTNFNQFTAHTTLGSILAVDLLNYASRSNSSGDFFGFVGVLLFILPESIHLHFPAGKNVTISPFISPLGCDYERLSDDSDRYYPGISGGVKLNIYYKNISISPYASVLKFYETNEKGLGIRAGAMFGINF